MAAMSRSGEPLELPISADQSAALVNVEVDHPVPVGEIEAEARALVQVLLDHPIDDRQIPGFRVPARDRRFLD